MTTDFRALCTELVRIANALDGGAPLVSNQGQALDGYSALAAFRDVATRARAALAEPELEGPTYDDLSDLCSQHGLDVDSWPLEKFDALWEIVRVVLARWGQPS